MQYLWNIVDRWFEPVEPSRDYDRRHYALLLIMIGAGAFLRFWHLDAVGLHGDEDIMGLAARGVVEHGTPILPSGMVYTRALAHTYLLAGTTMFLGDTEWALRLPSAVVGSLIGIFAFFFGRRFLDPWPNLAFVALATFLPAMIEVSQTARMYVFLAAGLLIFGSTVFRWERTRTLGALTLSIVAWLLTAHFHALAVFALPLLLFPGLANRSTKQLCQGGMAMTVGYAAFRLLGHINRAGLPDPSDRLEIPEEAAPTAIELLSNGHAQAIIFMALALAALVLIFLTVRNPAWRRALPAALAIACGVAACATLNYHLGAIAFLFGGVMWFRADSGREARLLWVLSVVGIIAVIQLIILQGTGEFPGRKIVGALVGMPSVWPALRLSTLTLAGAILVIMAVTMATIRLAQGHTVPIHFLFFSMVVWAPLVAIGFFKWNVPVRYIFGQLPYFLLSVVAAVPYLIREFKLAERSNLSQVGVAAGYLVGILVIVNPVAAWQAARNDYSSHPDHRGAAGFVRDLKISQHDVLIAEDCINQTYYLGRVDFRLQSTNAARSHSVYRDGLLYGQYTGVPVIGSGRELEAVLDTTRNGDVYIIGSGLPPGLTRHNRSGGISEVLNSSRLKVVYVGRDRKTIVWKANRDSRSDGRE